MLVLYFCECHFSGRATPLLYGACSFKVTIVSGYILILANSVKLANYIVV